MAAWLVGGLAALYLLGCADIVFSDGRVLRALNAGGVSARLLDFLYGWLVDLIFHP
jgi:hypothetical protein